jgi:hypothetical protein
MSMPCASGSFLAVHTFAFSGKSARVRALLAYHWHFLGWSGCAAIKAEAPFELRLDCSDGVRRGCGGPPGKTSPFSKKVTRNATPTIEIRERRVAKFALAAQ